MAVAVFLRCDDPGWRQRLYTAAATAVHAAVRAAPPPEPVIGTVQDNAATAPVSTVSAVMVAKAFPTATARAVAVSSPQPPATPAVVPVVDKDRGPER